MIPLANLEELNVIWAANKRLPTLASRRQWAEARNLNVLNVNLWFFRRRRRARAKGIYVPSTNYDIPVGTPPTVKTEPVEQESFRSSSPDTFFTQSEQESLPTSPPPSEDEPPAHICVPSDNKSDNGDDILCELHLPGDFFTEYHEPEPQEENMDVDSNLVSPSEHLAPAHGFFEMDKKIYTPDGFQLSDSEILYPPAYIVEMSAQPNDFPILSKLSESDYLPPLPSDPPRPLPVKTLADKKNQSSSTLSPSALFVQHSTYKKHIDSAEFDTIIDGDRDIDTGTIFYRAFAKHMIIEWEGDDGWLTRKNLLRARSSGYLL